MAKKLEYATDYLFNYSVIDSVNGLIDLNERANITRPSAICLCGDSITRDSQNSNQWTDWGWGAWFRRSLNKSYTLDKEDVFAIASMGTSHLLTVQLPQVISSGCGIAITMIGTNDLGSGVDIKSNLEVFYDTLRDNGVLAIAMPILPHGAASPFSSENAAQAATINKYLYKRSQSDTNMIYMSALQDVTDFTTGYAKAGVLRDGIHTTKVGAKIIGDKIASLFNSVFNGPDGFDYAINGNLYNSTYNQNGNVITNPYTNGTSGTKQNGATGVAASGWFLRRSTAAAVFSVVGSKEVIDGVDYQVISLSGTGDGNLATFEFQVGSPPVTWVIGDYIESGVTIKADALNGVGYLAVASVINSTMQFDGAASGANGNFPDSLDADYRIIQRVNETPTSMRLKIDIQTVNGAAISGTIKVSKAYLEKVI